METWRDERTNKKEEEQRVEGGRRALGYGKIVREERGDIDSRHGDRSEFKALESRRTKEQGEKRRIEKGQKSLRARVTWRVPAGCIQTPALSPRLPLRVPTVPHGAAGGVHRPLLYLNAPQPSSLFQHRRRCHYHTTARLPAAPRAYAGGGGGVDAAARDGYGSCSIGSGGGGVTLL